MLTANAINNSNVRNQNREEILMSTATTTSMTPTKSTLETSTIRAISWRLIPFLGLAYFLAYLDRVNLGFAALTMNAELKFSPLVFSWGAGIFFIGYFIFEVPSNVILEKIGARIWIARIMITWGIVAALTAFVEDVRAREAAGTHFTAAQADRLGTDAQSQAEQVTARVTDIAGALAIDVDA